MNGRKWMLQHLAIETKEKQVLAQAVISTLVFFSLYDLPLSGMRVHELLLGMKATQQEVDQMLTFLVENNQVIQQDNLFALKKWDTARYSTNQLELTKKWQKIDRYFGVLAILPFVRQISVINSLALGTADSDSDIDFLVVTKPNRLYFVRSVIIVLFRLMGVYKTRQRIKDRFCFGFFVSQKNENLHQLLLQPEDPYLVFWLASLRPVLGPGEYRKFMHENAWIKTYFPNFDSGQRLNTIAEPQPLLKALKLVLELLLWVPASLAESLLRRIHIKHTFKLAENNTADSSTIATRDMVKLHGYDVRAEVAYRFDEALKSRR